MTSESQTLRWKKQVIIGDWVNLRIPLGSQQYSRLLLRQNMYFSSKIGLRETIVNR